MAEPPRDQTLLEPHMSMRPDDEQLLPDEQVIKETLGALAVDASLPLSFFGIETLETMDIPRLEAEPGGSEPPTQSAGQGAIEAAGQRDGAVGDAGTRAADVTQPPPTSLETIAPTQSYVPVAEIGRGGMGVVYRARQNVLRRDIAVKTTRFAPNAKRAKKFIAEALLTASLEHPNIVPVHDLTASPDHRLALAMKLIGGTTWRDKLRPTRPTPGGNGDPNADGPRPDLEYHLDVLMDVANALAFAHSKHIIHCDIKPSNVMLGEFGEVLLVDWGIAFDCRPEKHEDSPAPHISELSTPCGTPKYMAPELARGAGPELGPWTDIFLLGAVLYEILTGRAPHQGDTSTQVLWQAVEWRGPSFEGFNDVQVPPTLAAICERAMRPAPAERYASVTEMQDDVRLFLDHRQSLLIAERAQAGLERCVEQSHDLAADDRGGRNLLYSEFADVVAGFREALVLWPENDQAQAGEKRARQAFAEAALEHHDLGLAEAQAEHLDPDEAPVADLRQRISAARQARERARAVTRRLGYALALTAALIIVGLGVSYVLIDREHAVAEQRLSDIRRLADAHRLRDLVADYDEYWPAVPATAADMERWLSDARALVSGLEAHRRYAEKLAPSAEGRAADDAAQFQRWEYDNLTRLITGLETLASEMIPSMKERLAFARTVRQRSIDDHADAWAQARTAIALEPRYAGLDLEPQLGLVPIGPDPATGLWEFAHIQSGAIPARDDTGRIVRTEDMAIVLVLLPGGSFYMGAEAPSEARPLGHGNVDPMARAAEGPVHQVVLAPFFMGKYEMTQGQWQRFTGENPSAYPPGREIGGRVHDLLHPAELMRWKDAMEVVTHLGLTLPTEAQWEYAARGGTRTVFPTGDAAESLRGALNIADRYCKENGGPGSWHYEEWLDDGYVVHAPVGEFRANGFGLHDVVGNVWEWCLDRYSPYTAEPAPGNGARGLDGEQPRVFRGGGFRASAVHARSADRYSLYAPDYNGYDIGLRPARTLDPRQD